MLKDELQKQTSDALKAGDSVRVSTLRLLANALHNEEIAKLAPLSEEDGVAIVKRQLKQREEAIQAYRKAGRSESAEKEGQEATILKEFLPTQLTEREITQIVERIITDSGSQEFGVVMKQVMEEARGKADGKMVSDIVRQTLHS